MRIAVWHNLPSGGGKRQLYDHVRGLAEHGHTFEFFSPSSADLDYLPLALFGKEHVLPWPESPDAPWIFPSLRLQANDSRWRLKTIDQHCREAAEMIGDRFDLLYATGCQFVATAPIARYARIPKLLYLNEPYRPLYESLQGQPFASRIPRTKWSRLSPRYWKLRLWDWNVNDAERDQVRAEVEAARAFDQILVNSYYSRESILKAYGIAARVCYLGIDASAFYPSKKPRENHLIGVGSFTPAKNVELAIRAIGYLPEPRPKLIWVGNSALEVYLQSMIELAQTLHVPFEPLRLVSQEQLTELMGTALALICAPRLEPFGYTPLEANACGTPVIAVAEGGLRETVRHEVNGLVVDPEPLAMARAIQRLQQDPRLAQQLGTRGRELCLGEWSLAAATDRIEAELLKLV
jgi:glycosyltransferase involved in cell wall biosynthesis